MRIIISLFVFQAEDGIRDLTVTGVQTCALPICNKKNVRALMPELAEWSARNKNPFAFTTEASVNLADDDELLERSEERREGKRVDLGGRRIIKKKKKPTASKRDRSLRMCEMTHG